MLAPVNQQYKPLANAGVSALAGGDPTSALIDYGISLLPANIQATLAPGMQGAKMGMMLGNLSGAGAGAGLGVGLPLGVMAGWGAAVYGAEAEDRRRKHAAQEIQRQLSASLSKYTDPSMLAAELTKGIPQFLQSKGLPLELANNPKFREFYFTNMKKMFNEELKKVEEKLKGTGAVSPELVTLRATLEGPQSDYYKQAMKNVQDAKSKPGYYEKNKAFFDTVESNLNKNATANQQAGYYLYGGRAAERRGMNPYANPPAQPVQPTPANTPPANTQWDPYKSAFVPSGTVPTLDVSTARATAGTVPTALINNTPATSLTPQTQLTPVATTAPVQSVAPTPTIAPVKAYVPPMRPVKTTYQDYLALNQQMLDQQKKLEGGV